MQLSENYKCFMYFLSFLHDFLWQKWNYYYLYSSIKCTVYHKINFPGLTTFRSSSIINPYSTSRSRRSSKLKNNYLKATIVVLLAITISSILPMTTSIVLRTGRRNLGSIFGVRGIALRKRRGLNSRYRHASKSYRTSRGSRRNRGGSSNTAGRAIILKVSA